MTMNKGMLYIISGPSGSGKDTVLNEVFKRCPELKFSISVITRPMREGETADGKYRFISKAEFEEMIEKDQLLEHNEYVGNYYGTPRKFVEDCLNAGKDVMIEVDVNGARQIREKVPEAVSIFVCPPSFEVLKKRLTDRGTDGPEAVRQRLTESVGEIKKAIDYDYIVINDDLNEAVENTVSIIKASKLKSERNTALINGIVNQ
ncbi:MAG: guanylate kinase [Clostridia bacterium]|nr:guanylate kinase [Clostridia bacterium]